MIIIDFIDMTKRSDKLAMLEELELALESDKAKPQVGQLSDLGLVELTRHRQGQALFEIFTKKCPHCQGLGYQFDELSVSSPVAEGEYRAKAAKLKLPAFQKKNNENRIFNQKVNKPQQNEQNRYKAETPQQGTLLQANNIKSAENEHPVEIKTPQQPNDNDIKNKNEDKKEIKNNKGKERAADKRSQNNKKSAVTSVKNEETIEKIKTSSEIKIDEAVKEKTEITVDDKPKTPAKRGRKPSKSKKSSEPLIETASESNKELIKEEKTKKRLPRKAKKAKNEEK